MEIRCLDSREIRIKKNNILNYYYTLFKLLLYNLNVFCIINNENIR